MQQSIFSYRDWMRQRVWVLVFAMALASGLLLTIVPLGVLIYRIAVEQLSNREALAIFSEPWLTSTLVHTTILIAASTALATLLGAVMAWLNERTDARFGTLSVAIPVIPLLVPSVAFAIGWVFIGAPKVGFANALIQWAGITDFEFNIYSWPGLIWVYTVHGTPYAYLIMSAAFRNADPALEEAARVYGSSIMGVLWLISLPSVRPALIASALIVAINAFGLFSLPVILATQAKIDVLTVRIVRLLTAEYPARILDAQVLSVWMLIVVLALSLLLSRMTSSGQSAQVGGKAAAPALARLGRWRGVARVLFCAYLACASVLPLLALVIVSLQPFWSTTVAVDQFTLRNFWMVLFQNRLTIEGFENTIVAAGIAATIGIAIAFVLSLSMLVKGSSLRFAAVVLSRIPSVVPHIVMALAILVTFSGYPGYLSGTKLLLIIGFMALYLPSGAVAASNAIEQIGKDLVEAAQIAGAAPIVVATRVILPLAIPGLIAGWTILFVHMVCDLSASALLAGVRNPVVGFAILEIWETGSFGQLAAFSVLMCLVIAAVVAVGNLSMRGLTAYANKT